MTINKFFFCVAILFLSACGGGGGGGVPGVDTGSSSGGSSSTDSSSGYGASGTYYDFPTGGILANVTAQITQSGSDLTGTITINGDNCLGDTGGTISGTIGSLTTTTSSIRSAPVTLTITMNNGVKAVLVGSSTFNETNYLNGQYLWSFDTGWSYEGGSCDGKLSSTIALRRYGGQVSY